MEERRDSQQQLQRLCHPSDASRFHQHSPPSPAPPTAFPFLPSRHVSHHQRGRSDSPLSHLRSFNSRISPRTSTSTFLVRSTPATAMLLLALGWHWGRDSLVYRRKRIKGKPEIYQVSCPHLPASTSASRLTTFPLNSSDTLTFVSNPCFSSFNMSRLVHIPLKLSPRQLDFRRLQHVQIPRLAM